MVSGQWSVISGGAVYHRNWGSGWPARLEQSLREEGSHAKRLVSRGRLVNATLILVIAYALN